MTDLRKRHDEMFQLGNRKEVALQSRVDSVKARRMLPGWQRAPRRPHFRRTQELELDAVKLAEGDTPVTQRIRGLETKLASTLERLEEVLAQRKTYEQIAKRLREERTGLDPQARGLFALCTARCALC